MKTQTCLYVREDGKILIGEFPVEIGKVCKGCQGKGWITGIERPCKRCNPGGEWRSTKTTVQKYFEAVERAVALSVECADQAMAKDLIQENIARQWIKDGGTEELINQDEYAIKIKQLYPIPGIRYTTEMHNPCMAKRDCQEPGENGWKCLHTCKRQHLLAYITATDGTGPVVEPVFQEPTFTQTDVHSMLVDFALQYYNAKIKDVGNDAAEFIDDYRNKQVNNSEVKKV